MIRRKRHIWQRPGVVIIWLKRPESQYMQLFVRYLLPALAWLGACLWLSQQMARQADPWLAVVCAGLVALPLALSALYLATVDRIHRSSLYTRQGLLHRFATSRWLTGTIWVCWALLVGGSSVFWFATLHGTELLLLGVSVPLFYGLYLFCRHAASREMAPFAVTATALRLTRYLFTVAMTVTYLLLAHFQSHGEPPPDLLPSLQAINQTPLDPAHSHLIQIGLRLAMHWQAIEGHLLHYAAHASWPFLLLVGLSTLALFWSIGLLLSGFVIPVGEYRRVFAAISGNPEPPAVEVQRVFLTTCIATLLALVLIPWLAQIEQNLRRNAQALQVATELARAPLYAGEFIDGHLYRPGTRDALHQAAVDLLNQRAALRDALQTQGELAFQSMRDHVDTYLDHYYSLPTEYIRIASALTGNLEEALAKDLQNHLQSSPELEALADKLTALQIEEPALLAHYQSQREQILANNKLELPDDAQFSAVPPVNSEMLLGLEHLELVTFQQRMAWSGAAGIGGVIAAKVVAKIAAKGGLKLAASALAKAGTGKLASAAAGSATGAAIGSVIPGAGTFVGGALGFLAGLGIGLTMDAALLYVEEQYSREDFRAVIIEAIDEQEREFLAALLTELPGEGVSR